MAKFIFQAGVFFKRPLYPANTSTVVTVYNAETGTIAPIWNDRAGADPRANPGAIWQEGQIKFYIDPGRYNIVASNGSDSKTWNDVIIVDPDAGGGGSGNVPTGGTPGQVLAKASSADYDTAWVLPGGGSDRRTATEVTPSGGSVAFNYALGDYFILSMTEDILLPSITNPPPPGVGGTIAIRISQDSTPRTFVFPPYWNFTDSSPLRQIATGSGEDSILILTTFDGGAFWVATMDYLS